MEGAELLGDKQGAETEAENERGLSQRCRSSGGIVGGGESDGDESEG